MCVIFKRIQFGDFVKYTESIYIVTKVEAGSIWRIKVQITLQPLDERTLNPLDISKEIFI